MAVHRPAAVGIVIVLASGCSDGDCVAAGGVDCCSLSGMASLTIGGGTTETGFVELAEGAEMTVILSPSGLWMLLPSIRAHNVWPGTAGSNSAIDDPRIELTLHHGGDRIGGSPKDRLGLTATADGLERIGIWTPFGEEPTSLADMTVTIRGTISDACGRTATDSLDVVVRIP